MRYKVEWLKKGVFVDIQNGFSAEDFSNMEEELFSNDKIPTVQYIIISTIKVTPGQEINIPFAEYGFLRSFTDADQALKLAFICTHPVIKQSIDSYMSKSKELGNHWQIKRFNSFEEAQGWVA